MEGGEGVVQGVVTKWLKMCNCADGVYKVYLLNRCLGVYVSLGSVAWLVKGS